MYIGLAYWILILIWVVFGVFNVGGYGQHANWILLLCLFVFLGWKVFGPPLHA